MIGPMRAAIDIGSNSILLAIADDSMKLVYDEARVIGLAKGVRAGRIISDPSIRRAQRCLEDYKNIIRSHNATQQLKVVATESLRRPTNGLAVKEILEKTIEAPIELITGETEAELSFWSVEHEFPSQAEHPNLVFDIGGASTELVLGTKDGPQKTCSLKIGSVLLTEEFNLHGHTGDGQVRAALSTVRDLILSSNFREPKFGTQGFGVAGTMTSLLAIEKHIETYKRALVQGKSISSRRIEHWMNFVLSLSLEARQKIVGLQPERADVFGGGLIILKALVDHFRWSSVRCADSGVRIGLLHQMGPIPK